MLFFRMDIETETPCPEASPADFGVAQRQENARLGSLLEDVNSQTDHIAFAVSDWNKNVCTVIIAADASFGRSTDVQKAADEFTDKAGLRGKIRRITEISQNDFLNKLHRAERRSFIEDMEEFKRKYSISSFEELSFPNSAVTELMLDEPKSEEEAETKAKEMLCASSLLPELRRIERNETQAFMGHPVHYIIRADDPQPIRELLLGALHRKGRLISGRVVRFDTKECSRYPAEDLETLYSSLYGSAIVIRCFPAEECDYMKRDGMDTEDILTIAAAARRHRHDALTVFEIPRRDGKLFGRITEALAGITLVMLEEDTVFKSKAREYLKHLAREKGAVPDRGLFRELTGSEKGYNSADLQVIFREWYDEYLRACVYPSYGKFAAAKKNGISVPKGTAYRELREMTGLLEVKKVIDQAVAFHKTQKLFADRGVSKKRPAMHMVFTGNPGTAKTTVARLTAQIMKDNELLSEGRLIEVGRADLVGKYVGWTAHHVKDAFRRAQGSVLFIDEAYSLVDDRNGMYGDEAINTIVQEMENAREDTVVIFAGYPEKMEEFLERNPGLRSRVAFHVHFPDYSEDELYEILALMLKSRGLTLGISAEEKVRAILAQAKDVPGFGNGRYVRSLIERAEMRQASRLVNLPHGEVADSELRTLAVNDFEEICEGTKKERRIGF